jgi:hypothetical protein
MKHIKYILQTDADYVGTVCMVAATFTQHTDCGVLVFSDDEMWQTIDQVRSLTMVAKIAYVPT